MKKKNIMNKTTITVLIILMVASIVSIFFIDYQKTTYCRIENNLDVIGINGSECILYAISTTDTKDLDIDYLKSVGSCSNDFSDLETCEGQKMFFTVHALDSLCENCTTQGAICLGTYVTYQNISNETIGLYEEKFGYGVDENELLINLVKTCQGDISE